MKFKFLVLSGLILLNTVQAKADNTATNKIQVVASDNFIEAQEKLMNAKGSYRTAVQQEDAIKNMRKAAKLSLRAASLRSKAEKMQTKADTLMNKAGQQAVTRGLYITNPLSPLMMQPPPSVAKSNDKPSFVPVPGQSINIIAPKAEQVSYDGNDQSQQEEYLPEPPTLNNF